MKKISLFLLLIALCTIQCKRIDQKEITYHAKINDFNTLSRLFKDPPAEYSTIPFWVWNDEVTREKIDDQLEEFHSQRIQSVIIHTRPGLITEYLSENWFELNEYALDKADELGMKVWLYDENCFPSGYAGGHVQRQMPESYNQGQGLRLTEKKRISDKDTAESFIILTRKESGFVNITYEAGNFLDKKGEFYLFRKIYGESRDRLGGYPYPDLLIPGVTEKFIEITMPGYEKNFRRLFGDQIPGIFTDEPHIQPPTRQDIRWTPTLFEDFENKWGYRLQENLPSLFLNEGNYKKVRHDYYQLLIELFVERWSKPWNAYTEKNNLHWTGHYWEHAWPNPRYAGDNMILYAYHQTPGIDMLFNDVEGRPDQFGNIFAARELLSIANQFGRERTLSETYGASGWDLDFEAMKRLGDWEYAAGVNLMNQHLAYMTTKGSRKRDFPQSISWHASWWPHYHHLASHHARLSVALSAGNNINKILVVEPTTTTWMYFTPEQSRSHLGAAGITRQYGEDFKDFVEKLEEYKIEYDLASELVMKDFARIADSKWRIGQRQYDEIILGPHVENLNLETFELVRQYLEAGQDIYFYETVPEYIDGTASGELTRLIEQYEDQWIRIDDQYSDWIGHFQNKDFKVHQTHKSLFHQRRKLKDGQLIFWTNFDEKEEVPVDFEIPGKTVLWLDTRDGEFYELLSEKNGRKRTIRFTLPPGNSKVLFVHDEEIKAEVAPQMPRNFQPLENENISVRRKEPNVLVLDYCDVEVKGKTLSDINYLHATDSIFRLHGFGKSDIDHNPWNFTVQYKTQLIDTNHFSENSGFKAVFPFLVDEEYSMKPMQIGIEFGRLYEVWLNGRPLTVDPEAFYFDHSVDVYDVEPEQLQPGINEISLVLEPMHIHAELERLFVLGDFDLEPVGKGFKVINNEDYRLGSWTDQGLAFYPDALIYEKNLTIDSALGVKISIKNWTGTVASVEVNDQEAGIIGWRPYELDISNHIQPGKNKVEVIVYGSPRNLLGPHYYDPPEGIATPWSWNTAPQSQPPGNEYSLIEYGLFEDFDVLIRK